MAEFRLDQPRNRLLVRSENPMELTVLLKLPSRRFMQKQQVFVVPMTRANAQQLMDAYAVNKMRLSDQACEVLTKIATMEVGTRAFPDWYVFKTQPRKQQREALEKIYRDDKGALLMRMGTGKSKVAIDFMTAHFYERRIDAVTIICPQSVKSVWAGENGELMKHSPCPVAIVDVDSSFDPTDYPLQQQRLFWFLVGVESLSQGHTFSKFMPFLQNRRVGVFVDESSRIKTHNKIRTKRVIEMRDHSVVRLIGTGTPITKNLIDLYSQFEFLDPNIIGVGDWYAFRNRYAVMGGFKNKKIVSYDNVEELMGLIEPYSYRCDKPEGLPPQIFMKRFMKMTDEQREAYRSIKKGRMDGVNSANVLTKVLHLQQVCGGFYSEDPIKDIDPLTQRKKVQKGQIHRLCEPHANPKICAIKEILDEIGDNTTAIIWAKFIWEIDDLVEALKEYGPIAKLTGGMTDLQERVQLRDDFQAGKYRLMIANQQVGGIGHTFTRANYNIYYSNTQSLEDRLQSEDRTHRIGQDAESVTYVDLIMEKTVDETIYESIGIKKDLDQYIRDKLDEAGANRQKVVDKLLGEA